VSPPRRRARGIHGIAALAGVALLTACTSPSHPPIRPPASAAAPDEDDGRLWLAASEAEERIVPTEVFYADTALQRYVEEIAERLTPPAYREARGEGLRVRVRKDPRLNASALSHGTLVIHTGMIARAENEAQLAGVLAHEIAHVTHRHDVREARAIRHRRAPMDVAEFLELLEVTAAAVDPANRGHSDLADEIARDAPPLLSLGLNLSFVAMVSGYPRDFEREADKTGLRLMADAGYDPREMSTMLRAMRDESDERGAVETFFWGSRSRLSERTEAVEKLAPQFPVSPRAPIASGPEFERRAQWLRVTNAQYDAFLGRVAIARGQVSRAAAVVPPAIRPTASEVFHGLMWSSAARGARMALNDERLANEFMDTALASMARAATLAPRGSAILADAYRIKGLMLYEWWASGSKRCQSKPDLERYLELRPAASDGDVIRTKLADLEWC
jgi:Zn-dependent protease with chaperone function